MKLGFNFFLFELFGKTLYRLNCLLHVVADLEAVKCLCCLSSMLCNMVVFYNKLCLNIKLIHVSI